MLKTKICNLLNIEHPIIQGGMAWASTAPLCAAVSESGGLGVLGSGGMTPEILREQIKLMKGLTNKSFGVNLMLLNNEIDEMVRIVLEEEVPVVTTGAGSPGKYLKDFEAVGIKVLPVTSCVALAKRLEESGVDAIIAEGSESGGHVGEISSMPLIPQIVDAVDLPVIAAGGIADGRGLVAALALGADGVQIGTRFLCSSECEVHPSIKEKIIKVKDRDTIVTGRMTGHPCRIVKNKLAKEIEELEKKGDIKKIDEIGMGRLRAAMVDGDVERGSVMAGQISGMIKDIKPVKVIMEEILSEAEEVLASLAGLF